MELLWNALFFKTAIPEGSRKVKRKGKGYEENTRSRKVSGRFPEVNPEAENQVSKMLSNSSKSLFARSAHTSRDPEVGSFPRLAIASQSLIIRQLFENWPLSCPCKFQLRGRE